MFKGMVEVYRDEHRVFLAPPSCVAFCADCRKCADWYVVKKSVWERAWPGTSMKSAREPMAMKHFLCIRCLEKRLGRRLTRHDFDMRRSHNKPKHNRNMSRQFRNRLQVKAEPG